jgi:hypothetical protein
MSLFDVATDRAAAPRREDLGSASTSFGSAGFGVFRVSSCPSWEGMVVIADSPLTRPCRLPAERCGLSSRSNIVAAGAEEVVISEATTSASWGA